MQDFQLPVLYKPNNTYPVNTAFLLNQTFFYIYNLQTYKFHRPCDGLLDAQAL